MRSLFTKALKGFPLVKENDIVVSFDTVRTYTNKMGRKVRAKKVEISGLHDSPSGKYVIAIADLPVGDIVLWSGSEYDAIGQWTNDDVIARINEIFKSA